MQSITYGEVSLERVCQIIKEQVQKDSQSTFIISVGTDSQNITGFTKLVSVITLVRKNKGGIFFYDVHKVKPIRNLKQKIFLETHSSIELASQLLRYIQDHGVKASVEIHVDIGRRGDTRNLIKEVVGWVMGLGFECKMKPDSYTSSGIADKIAKR